jgi:hypothetical protein
MQDYESVLPTINDLVVRLGFKYKNRDVSCFEHKGILRIEFMSGTKTIGVGHYSDGDIKTASLIGLDISNWVMNSVLDKRLVR